MLNLPELQLVKNHTSKSFTSLDARSEYSRYVLFHLLNNSSNRTKLSYMASYINYPTHTQSLQAERQQKTGPFCQVDNSQPEFNISTSIELPKLYLLFVKHPLSTIHRQLSTQTVIKSLPIIAYLISLIVDFAHETNLFYGRHYK